MALIASDADDRCDQLALLSERLAGLIDEETALYRAGRYREAAPIVAEKGKLTAVYQMELRRIGQQRDLIETASQAARDALRLATERLREVLARHEAALKRARDLTDGLVQAIAEEVRAEAHVPLGYGGGVANARPIALDARA